jgi:hypothetical protein
MGQSTLEKSVRVPQKNRSLRQNAGAPMGAMMAVLAKTRTTVELSSKGLLHFHHSDVLERFFPGFQTRQQDDRI